MRIRGLILSKDEAENTILLRIDVDKLIASHEALREQLALAVDALKELKLSHEHNERNAEYRPLGDSYGYCSICSTKVGLDEDLAKETLKKLGEK